MDEDNKNAGVEDVATKVIVAIKKVPSFLWPIIGYAVIGLCTVMAIIILIMSVAGVAENIQQGVDDFGQRLGNLFTFNGWGTDYEVAQEQEKKYYDKLDSVKKDFSRKYNVEINTTLITSTLFYAKTMGDYASEGDQGEDGSDETSFLENEAKFFKTARAHIETLARYMMIENKISYKCGENANITMTPMSKSAITSQWGLELVDFKTHNTLKTIYTYKYKNKFPYCDYEDIKEDALEILAKGGENGNYDAFYKKWFKTEKEKAVFMCPSNAYKNTSKECILRNPSPNKPTYSTDNIQGDSVYFLRLTEDIKAFGFIPGKSFIEIYYKDFIGENSKEEDINMILTGIYDLYNSVSDGTLDEHILGTGFFEGGSGDIGDIVYFSQRDPQWVSYPYAGWSVGGAGCGLVANAMIISTLTGATVTPLDLAKWTEANGKGKYQCPGCGSYVTLNTDAPAAYGLKSRAVNRSNREAILSALATGEALVIALVGQSVFTSSGHYTVLTGVNENGEVHVVDGYTKSLSGYYSFEYMQSISKGTFWIITR